MNTNPVFPSFVWRSRETSTPSPASRSRRKSPNSSWPTTPAMAELPPRRATPTATLAGDPPWQGTHSPTSFTGRPGVLGRKSTNVSPAHTTSMAASSVHADLDHELHALERAPQLVGDEQVQQLAGDLALRRRERRALPLLQPPERGEGP